MTKDIPQEVRAFFSNNGKKSAAKVKRRIASGELPADYFSRISKMRKKHGRQKIDETTSQESSQSSS